MLISSKDYWASSRLFLSSICLRTSRLSSSFLKPVFCHSLLYFPISSLSFLFFQSQCPISPTFNRHPSRTSHPKFPKPSLHTLFENPFIPTSSLSICTTSFFFPSSFGISHHQPWNSSLFNSSFSHKVGSYLS